MKPEPLSLFFCGVFAILTPISGCEEDLPPYQDPRQILKGRSRGEYTLTVKDNSMNVYLVVTNAYDEALQAKAVLKGTLKIALQRNTEIEKTVELQPSNLIQARNYIPQTGEIVLDPGDSVRLLYKWDWIDDNGMDLRLGVFQYRVDLSCADFRCLALEETFILSGEVTVFDRVAPVRFAPTYFSVRFVSSWVDPKFCPPVLSDVPPSYGTLPCVPDFIPIP